MPGLWKAWKAKSRLPPLSTSPLEISPTAGEIPTFPQRRRRGRMGKWKTKSRFSTFPPPRFLSPKRKHKSRRRASPAPARALGARIQASSQGNLRRNARALRALMFHRQDQRKETSRSSIVSGSPRIGIEGPFQAHRALELIFDFRLICGLENADGLLSTCQASFRNGVCDMRGRRLRFLMNSHESERMGTPDSAMRALYRGSASAEPLERG